MARHAQPHHGSRDRVAIRGRLWRLGNLSHFVTLYTSLRYQEHGQLLWFFGIRSKLRGGSITYPSAVVTAPGASANLRPAVSILGPLPDAIQCGGVFLTQPYILSPAAMTGMSSSHLWARHVLNAAWRNE